MIKRVVILTIHGYRRLVSPFLPPSCRFEPTCSRYAIHAIEHYGIGKGGWMALKRLFKCHPLARQWGYDPVFPASQRQARHSSSGFLSGQAEGLYPASRLTSTNNNLPSGIESRHE